MAELSTIPGAESNSNPVLSATTKTPINSSTTTIQSSEKQTTGAIPETLKKKIVEAYPKVLDRLAKIEKSPRYSQLSPESKTKLREHLYDKYIVPSYTARGLEAPAKKDWVNKTVGKEDNRLERLTGYSMAVNKGIGEVGEGLLSFSQWVNNKANPIKVNKQLSLSDLIVNKKKPESEALGNASLEAAKKPFKWLEDKAGTYLGDHQSQGLIESALRFGASELPKLPLYHGANAAVGGVSKAIGVDAIFNSGKIAPKVLKLIHNAAEGYLIGHGLGESEQQARHDAGVFAALGLPSLAIAGGKVGVKEITPRVDKFFRSLMSMGGRKLVEFAIDEGLNNVTRAAIIKDQKLTEKVASLKLLPQRVSATRPELSPASTREKLGQAGYQVLNDISKSYYGRLYQFLRANEREQVYREIEKHLNKSIERSVSDNPGMTTATIKQEVTTQAQKNPFFNRGVKLLEAAGADVAQMNAEAAVEHNAIVTEKKSVPKVLQRLGKGDVQSVTAKEEAKASAYAKSIAEMVGNEAPGAANYKSPEFEGNLLKLAEHSMHLENKQHQITFLWGIRSQFPKPIRLTIEDIMRRHFKPEAGFTSRDYNRMVATLDQHMADVTKGIKGNVPEIKKHGGKVFRSTVITPNTPKTKYQEDVIQMIRDLEKK